MKIVLFGPERRVGAWGNGRIIDLNRAFASYLREQRGDARAQAHADERIPLGLENFIALGDAALEDADRAIQHVAESGVGLAAIVHDANTVQLHAPWPGRRIACVGGNYARKTSEDGGQTERMILPKNPPFILREPQDERGTICNQSRFSVHAEPSRSIPKVLQQNQRIEVRGRIRGRIKGAVGARFIAPGRQNAKIGALFPQSKPIARGKIRR